MSTTTTARRSRAIKRESVCPECGSPIKTEAPSEPGKHYVCNDCGAISITGRDGYPRLLRTEEWLAIIHLPTFLDMLELRESIVERLSEQEAAAEVNGDAE
jgi:predicted RNA-binding Zn-ribbon protein involved in translation (DUF1610 family)